jgi:hypothetical protein
MNTPTNVNAGECSPASPCSAPDFWSSPIWKEINDCRMGLRNANGEGRQILLLKLKDLEQQLNALPNIAISNADITAPPAK